MDDFRMRLEEQGEFDNNKRFWDSIADEAKIDYQFKMWEEQEKQKAAALSGYSDIYADAASEIMNWNRRGEDGLTGKERYRSNVTQEVLGRLAPGKTMDELTIQEKSIIENQIASEVRRRGEELRTDRRGMIQNPVPFQASALQPRVDSSTLRSEFNSNYDEMQELRQRISELEALEK